MGYRDILKRNEELIDNVYEMQEDIIDLADENEYLNEENNILFSDNINLSDENDNMKDGIENLHRETRRGYARKRRNFESGVKVKKEYVCEANVSEEEVKPTCPLQPKKEKVDRVAFSLYMSDKTKNIIAFSFLIGLILLLGLGITPGTKLTYESLLDCYLELVFNLYNVVILGFIGFILRRIWKKINK